MMSRTMVNCLYCAAYSKTDAEFFEQVIAEATAAANTEAVHAPIPPSPFRKEPLYPGSTMTELEAAVLIAAMRCSENQHSKQYDTIDSSSSAHLYRRLISLGSFVDAFMNSQPELPHGPCVESVARSLGSHVSKLAARQASMPVTLIDIITAIGGNTTTAASATKTAMPSPTRALRITLE
jgi:hypothetical protein